MKSNFGYKHRSLIKLLIVLLISSTTFQSCDIYPLDNEEPEWLGGSIYEYLQKDGHFTNYLRLIDDLQYSSVLQLTGSKTIFVANDSAFNVFYQDNEWGVTKYEDLSLAQKKIILNYTMINNAFVMDVFANFYSGGTLYEGIAMRRNSALNDIDTIPFDKPEDVPLGTYYDNYRAEGMRLIKDHSTVTSGNNTMIPIVFFAEDFLRKYSFTAEDFSLLTNGLTRNPNDIHLFNNRVIKKDIVCKNGYINILDRVMIPPTNMAEFIFRNSKGTIDESKRTSIFSKLLDRFSAPYYDAASTSALREKDEAFLASGDSVFAKEYFASIGGKTKYPVKGNEGNVNIPTLLPYNPGWNCYKATSAALQGDMGAMFVPSDKAMNDYFNSGVGEILKSRYGSWDNVPDAIILPFIKRHMRTSLIESVPSKFDKMVDAENYRLPVEKSHIERSYTGVNGEVYITNQVYPPVDYISVYSPVLLSANSKIMNWAINISETSVDGTQFAFYKLYLNSLVSKYSLFIPTDEFFNTYIDPIAYSQEVPGALKFWYNTKTSAVNATVYKYDVASGTVGDSVDVITSASFLKNRLWDILDSHIVVGDVTSGGDYFVTKANDIIKVNGSGQNMQIQGGGDMNIGTACNVIRTFDQANGKTFFIDKPIQAALTSVYKKLKDTEQFQKFFELLNNVPDTCIQKMFDQQGYDYRIKFFNAYRYTIYVPTNDAIQAALNQQKIWTWEDISLMPDGAEKNARIAKMIRFLKYHFQDNAVFVGQNVNSKYQSATIKTNSTSTIFGTAKNKYYKIGVNGDGNNLTLTAETFTGQAGVVAHVDKSNNLYNLVVKDYIFGYKPNEYKNIDGTGPTPNKGLFSASTISTSASAVIHQIDNVLLFE